MYILLELQSNIFLCSMACRILAAIAPSIAWYLNHISFSRLTVHDLNLQIDDIGLEGEIQKSRELRRFTFECRGSG